MKTASFIKSTAIGSIPLSSRLKIFLLVLAFTIIAGTLWYTHNLVEALSKKEKEVADLYAKSLEYIANGKAGDSDYSFLFTEIINTIDFPVVITDRTDEPTYPYSASIKNISMDSLRSREEQYRSLKDLIREMDRSHPPIKVAYQDTIILSYLHYGESILSFSSAGFPISNLQSLYSLFSSAISASATLNEANKAISGWEWRVRQHINLEHQYRACLAG